MRRLVTGMTISRGFTLIEILIVIVIVGITVGFALLSFGDFGASRRALFSADQLVNTLRMAQQQAILETSTLGLRIDNRSYQILRFEESTNWKPISNKGVFKINYFPPNTLITLKTNNKPLQGSPSIVINSSGDMTPFTLDFGTNKEVLAVIKGSHNGSIKITAAKTK
jgi:general secretion pathway protein H